MIECRSCAARVGEAPFSEVHKRGTPRLCDDCLRESRRQASDKIARDVLITRKCWRARERARLARPQADLLDWLGA